MAVHCSTWRKSFQTRVKRLAEWYGYRAQVFYVTWLSMQSLDLPLPCQLIHVSVCPGPVYPGTMQCTTVLDNICVCLDQDMMWLLQLPPKNIYLWSGYHDIITIRYDTIQYNIIQYHTIQCFTLRSPPVISTTICTCLQLQYISNDKTLFAYSALMFQHQISLSGHRHYKTFHIRTLRRCQVQQVLAAVPNNNNQVIIG